MYAVRNDWLLRRLFAAGRARPAARAARRCADASAGAASRDRRDEPEPRCRRAAPTGVPLSERHRAEAGAAAGRGIRRRGDIVSHTLHQDAYRPLLDRAIAAARDALVAAQSSEGYWLFELEADCTIPAEYIMMMHFLDEIDLALEAKIAAYLRAASGRARRLAAVSRRRFQHELHRQGLLRAEARGRRLHAPHMVRARAAILQRGGAARATCSRALRWRCSARFRGAACPTFPSRSCCCRAGSSSTSTRCPTGRAPSWCRCSFCARASRSQRTRETCDIRELFLTPPEKERDYFRDSRQQGGLLGMVLLAVDRLGRMHRAPDSQGDAERATRLAEQWMLERLNGEDGLGAIFPAMVNALEVMVILGYPADDPRRVTAKRALQKLLVIGPSSAYCQPCVSPVWDTALASLAMQEAGCSTSLAAATRALDWLQTEQLLDEPGDWRVNRPQLAGGGWAFQFANELLPGSGRHRGGRLGHASGGQRSRLRGKRTPRTRLAGGHAEQQRRICGIRRRQHLYYLNKIPFADHGALLDPPTSDVTARVVTVLARIGRPQDKPALNRALVYLRDQQEAGRLLVRPLGDELHLRDLVGADCPRSGRRRCGGSGGAARGRVAASAGRIRTAVGARATTAMPSMLRSGQYFASTPYQTAWALLALLASGEAASEAVRRGSESLDAHAAVRRTVERPELHRARLSARVLSEIPWLQRLFPAVGTCNIPHAESHRNPTLNVAGVVAALTSEARALGPVKRGSRSGGCSRTARSSR